MTKTKTAAKSSPVSSRGSRVAPATGTLGDRVGVAAQPGAAAGKAAAVRPGNRPAAAAQSVRPGRAASSAGSAPSAPGQRPAAVGNPQTAVPGQAAARGAQAQAAIAAARARAQAQRPQTEPKTKTKTEPAADLAKLTKPASLRKLYLAVFSALGGLMGDHWQLDQDTADTLAQLTHDTVKYYWPKMEPENPAVSLGIALGVVVGVRVLGNKSRRPAAVGDRKQAPVAAAGDRPQAT